MTAAPDSPSARRSVEALLHEKQAAYLEEYAALVDAFYELARTSGDVDPKVADIVETAGLSNQVFYRHFPSKDALVHAVLEDGWHRLVGYLTHRTAGVDDPLDAIREWIRGVSVQAVDPVAAARSRPFAVHAARLRARFPEAQAESVDRLLATLESLVERAVSTELLPAVAQERVDLVFWTVFDQMQRDLLTGVTPTTDEIDRRERFCLAGLVSP